MTESVNILIFQELTTEGSTRAGGALMHFSYTLYAKVSFIGPDTGEEIGTLLLSTLGSGIDAEAAARSCIQKFLDGIFFSVIAGTGYSTSTAIVNKKSIHEVRVLIQEPFKSLLENLFDVSKWKVDLKKLTAPQSAQQ